MAVPVDAVATRLPGYRAAAWNHAQRSVARPVHALISGVEETTAVAVVARITHAVGVPVCLVRVGALRAVVAAVRHPVAVPVRAVVVSRADVARIAGTVAIGVRLVRVRNVWAVV